MHMVDLLDSMGEKKTKKLQIHRPSLDANVRRRINYAD
jgi:hypothetical protein